MPLACYQPRRRRALLGLAGALLAATAMPARAQRAPAPAVQAFTEVTSLLLGLPFDDAQRQRIRQFIEGYWQRGQPREMKAVHDTVAFLAQLRDRAAPMRQVCG